MSSHERQPDFSNVRAGTSSTAAGSSPGPDFSNVRGGTSSTAPSTGSAVATALPPEPAPAATELKTYTVAPGDSLWKIAQRVYGHGGEWQKIYQANKDRIQNPDLIHPGQSLVIPD